MASLTFKPTFKPTFKAYLERNQNLTILSQVRYILQLRNTYLWSTICPPRPPPLLPLSLRKTFSALSNATSTFTQSSSSRITSGFSMASARLASSISVLSIYLQSLIFQEVVQKMKERNFAVKTKDAWDWVSVQYNFSITLHHHLNLSSMCFSFVSSPF